MIAPLMAELIVTLQKHGLTGTLKHDIERYRQTFAVVQHAQLLSTRLGTPGPEAPPFHADQSGPLARPPHAKPHTLSPLTGGGRGDGAASPGPGPAGGFLARKFSSPAPLSPVRAPSPFGVAAPY